MAKYMIHACDKRIWYVQNFLVPSMKAQGIAIKDIDIYVDEEHKGNLWSCIDSFDKLPETGGTWHLQDDVCICRDFKQRTIEHDTGIVTGLCNSYSNEHLKGFVRFEHMWYSFPCIRIPNEIAHNFVKWFKETAQYKVRYAKWVQEGKYDDSFFLEFLTHVEQPQWLTVYNLAPNLIQHIDYLIGGSTVNTQRKQEASSVFFEDSILINKLAKDIEKYLQNNTLQV